MTDLHGIATESTGTLVLDVESEPGLFKDVTLIEEGWGQSGYYPGDVLHNDGVKIFVEGTRVFLDHEDGPVEKAKNVMGVLASPARAVTLENGKKALKGDIRIFTTGTYNHEWVKERAKAKAVELSIRAGVDYAQGTREGRYGKVVSRMTNAYSVDVVARGGAGGKFGVIQESARLGSATEEEGSDMPLSKEELAEVGAVAGAAVAEALKTPFGEITSALGDLKTIVSEAKKTEEVGLSAREINEKIAAAEFPEGSKAVDRSYTAIEALEVPTEKLVDEIISREKEVFEEALAAAKAEIGDGHAVFDEAGTPVKQGEGYKPGGVAAWGTKEATK